MKKLNFTWHTGKLAMFILIVGSCLASISIRNESLQLLDMTFSITTPILRNIMVMLGGLRGWGLESSLFCAGLLTIGWLTQKENCRKRISFHILCVLLAFIMTIGRSIRDTYTLRYFTENTTQLLYTLLITFGYYYLLTIVLSACVMLLRKLPSINALNENKIAVFIFEKHPVLLPAAIILLCSLPYIIAFFPGTVQWDGHAQIYYYYRLAPWTHHHPLFSTWVMGSVFAVGRKFFHSDNLGVFFNVIPQLIFQCYVMALCFKTFKRLRSPMFLRVICLSFFALFPLWRISGITLMKDTMYYILMLWSVQSLIELLLDHLRGKESDKKEFLPFLKTGLSLTNSVTFIVTNAMGFGFRHNGVILALGMCFFGFLLFRKLWPIWLGSLATLGVMLLLVNVVMSGILRIGDWPSRESMSVPLQQTARYVQNYYGEVTDAEKEIISKILPLEMVETYHEPEGADGIKGVVYENIDATDMKNYWIMWMKQGLKHPLVYVEAFLSQSYGYVFPGKQDLVYYDELGCYWIGSSDELKEGVDFYFVNKNLGNMRQLLRELAHIVRELPIIGMLYNTGVPALWCLIGTFFLIAIHKKRNILILMPAIMTIGICMLSPINGTIRYMLPVMVLLPLVVAWLYWLFKQTNDNAQNQSVAKIYPKG